MIDWRGRPAALKVFKTTDAGAGHGATALSVSSYIKEIEIMARLDHPNIIKFLGHGMMRSRNGFLLMELAEGLSLFDLLYPSLRLVLPSADPLPAAMEALRSLNALLQQRLESPAKSMTPRKPKKRAVCRPPCTGPHISELLYGLSLHRYPKPLQSSPSFASSSPRSPPLPRARPRCARSSSGPASRRPRPPGGSSRRRAASTRFPRAPPSSPWPSAR